MSTTLAPLPADLSELGRDGLKEAIASRETLLENVFKQAGDEYDMTKVTALSGDSTEKTKALRVLNGELTRLQTFAEQVDDHPGHPEPKGGWEGSRTKTNGAAYGRVEGLGASFLSELKKQAARG